ncbi:MAG: redox-regulated ATPase YchF [bacterium]
MRIGIIGLDQSGKTTLFNALTESSGAPEQGAKGKQSAHLSMVKVPDVRLDGLHELFPTARKVQATIEYVDIGGLSKGATQRKGFQEQFLANVRNVDALLCILRRFESDLVAHPEGSIDPARDWSIIQDEFLLSDMAILENRIERLSSEVRKVKDDAKNLELALLEKCHASLESEQPLRELEFDPAEDKMLRGFQFLTAKPVLLVLNISEDDLVKEAEVAAHYAPLAAGKNKVLLCLSAHLEMEIAQLPQEDKATFQKEMGITEPALNKMIRYSYDLLGLIPFFTAGEQEVRAWTIKKETRAQNAAGAIHSDMERGFIRAEVVEVEKLSELGSFAKCKEVGVLRLEGKEYIVKNGDVITFRFNV